MRAMARNGKGSYGNSINDERLFEELHTCLFATQNEKRSFGSCFACFARALRKTPRRSAQVHLGQRELAECADIDQVDEIGCTALPFNQDG
jgi:hypothetical protein